MTVIAWDGKTLAADKRSVAAGGISIVTKIRKINGNLIAFSGDFAVGMELFAWFSDGSVIANYPELQKKNDSGGIMLVITPERKILKYESTPYPFEIENDFCAIGSGRDYAMGAMEMGADAVQAVEVASKWESGCGNGVDTLEFL